MAEIATNQIPIIIYDIGSNSVTLWIYNNHDGNCRL